MEAAAGGYSTVVLGDMIEVLLASDDEFVKSRKWIFGQVSVESARLAAAVTKVCGVGEFAHLLIKVPETLATKHCH